MSAASKPTVGLRRARGFTLIELMIVVAIIAILAAIAYPSYTEYVRRSYRAQAKADLVEYAGLAERFYTANNTYVGFTLPTFVSPRETGAPVRYNLTPAAAFANATTFTLTATPTGGQANDKCGTLSINQAGVKTNSTGTLADCW
ncbi:MAG: type IV pilin protein [Pseudoxanthomonas sp.]